MENNLVFSIPNEASIRQIVREELNVFLQHLTLYLSEKGKPQYLNCKEVADLLCISLPTIRRWTRDGLLPNYRFGNSRRVLYKYEEVQQLLERKNLMKWKIAS